jgi:aminoglycoside phosphotransferase (APT) family kinase protein
LTAQERCFRFLDAQVDVCAPRSTLCWLEEFCCPAFQVERPDPQAGAAGRPRLRVLIDGERQAALLEQGRAAGTVPLPCFRLDTKLLQYPSWSHQGVTHVQDTKLDCLYCIDGRQVEIVGRPGGLGHRQGAMRIIREILCAQLQGRDDTLELHAAAFEVAGRAIVMAGPKGAGKTTGLCGGLGGAARFLGNDRLLLRFERDAIWVHGVPSVVRIRPSTMSRFSWLQGRFPAATHVSRLTRKEADAALPRLGVHGGDERLGLSASQFLWAAESSAVSQARLEWLIPMEAAALLPQASMPRASLTSWLARCLYGAGVDAELQTCFGRLGNAARKQRDPEATRALLERLASHALEIDPPLAGLLAGLGSDVQSVRTNTRRRSSKSQRASYRVSLDGGGILKARRGRNRGGPPRSWELLQQLDDPRFSAVLAAQDEYVIEEWIDGTTLEEHPQESEFVGAVADLLGTLHATTHVGGVNTLRATATTGVVRRLHEHLELLAAAGILSRQEAAEIREVASHLAPAVASTGLIHGDLCPENIVVDAHGCLRVVDNEAMTLGFLDHDLARTRCRWGMSDASWRLFLDVYGRHRAELPAPEAFRFWCLGATVSSARVRAVHGLDGLDAALHELRRLMSPQPAPRVVAERGGHDHGGPG